MAAFRHGRRPIATSDNVTPFTPAGVTRLPRSTSRPNGRYFGALYATISTGGGRRFPETEHFAVAMRAHPQAIKRHGQIANVVTLNALLDRRLMEN
jgi:hypothetical protein